MKKLTYEEAYQCKMSGLALKKDNPSLRIGQAIMLSLPDDIYTSLVGTSADFFQSDCLGEIIPILYSDLICTGE